METTEQAAGLPEGHKVSAEVAEAEFERFAEAMDLDLDLEGMDDDDKRDFLGEKRRVVRALQRGHIVVDERGQPVFTPQLSAGAALVFHEPNGAAIMEMDRAKKGKNIKAANFVLAAITRQPVARFAKMEGRDYKVCQALLALFLGG